MGNEESINESLKAVIKKIESLEKAVQWKFLSRWKFERFLDELAKILCEYLSNELNVKLGCSLLYRLEENHYCLGGSSSERLQMDRKSRYYDLNKQSARESFTGYSLLHNVSFLLDDFLCAVERFKPNIQHKSKDCELLEKITYGYISIPACMSGSWPAIIRDEDYNNCDNKKVENPPIGILRITFAEKDYASKAKEFLKKILLRKVFELLKKGCESALENKDNDALAIADLQTDLLRYRTNEFAALDALAFHIQTLFRDCECSIFLAHKGPEKSKITQFNLYLAATTALSKEQQHKKFRETFFTEFNSYSCSFDSNGNPITSKLPDAAKTEKAFCNPDSPVLENHNLGSPIFPNQGEIKDICSFLGLAIPPGDINKFPYGVIRIVRESGDEFLERDRLLAATIAKALTYWLDFFPKNEELKIVWPSERLKNEVLSNLFGIGLLSKIYPSLTPEERSQRIYAAELEFSWLLQKIFFASTKVIVKQLFSGKSGSVVIRVENDSGLDLILKCSKRESGNKYLDNEIWREISNYRRYIEGKLDLNHNVIYPELTRETRQLVGFATSFLHCRHRSRISITEFCKQERKKLNKIEWALTRVIDSIFTGVWSWWYESKQVENPPESNMESFVSNEIKDKLFDFFKDMKKFDDLVLHKLRNFDSSFPADGQHPSPSSIWDNFCSYIKKCTELISWQETVTHGDAHGDNIFFDPESLEIWIIDFARTAKRISIFDLAMIESDLKFRQLPNVLKNDSHIASEEFLERYKQFEEAVASQDTYEKIIIPKIDNDPILRMFSKLIIDIRQLACQKLLRTGSFNDYQIVLFLLSFKFMKVQEISNERILLPYLSALTLQKVRFNLQQSI